MSPWVDPADIFDLADGEAYVIRTAGNIVTQETVRSIMLAMVADRISDVIVLGHTNCTNADKGLIYKNLDRFMTKLPPRGYFRETLATREKALKYFGIFDDEIDNIHVQVENLKFLKTIQPGLNVTGMLYNEKNGHVYTLAELGQIRDVLSKDPDKDINTLIPTRYTALAKARESTAKPVAPQRYEYSGDDHASTAISGDGGVDEKVDGCTGEGAAVDEHGAEIPKEFAGQQLAFEKLMEAMQKSIGKVAKVRIFMPRIRMPHIKGLKTELEANAPTP
jgi:carbonic anhydrase